MGRVGGGGGGSRSSHSSSMSRSSHSSSMSRSSRSSSSFSRSSHSSSSSFGSSVRGAGSVGNLFSSSPSRPVSHHKPPVAPPKPQVHRHTYEPYASRPKQTVIVNNYGSETYENNRNRGNSQSFSGMGGPGSSFNNYSSKETLREMDMQKSHRHKKNAVIGIVISIILFVILLIMQASENSHVLEKVKLSGVEDVGFFTDDEFMLGHYKTEHALRELYEKSGIPVYMLTDAQTQGITLENCKEYVDGLYDSIMKDDSHVLLCYFDDVTSTGYWEWSIGKNAQAVFSDYMVDKLIDCIEYYWEYDMSNDEVFSSGVNKFISNNYEKRDNGKTYRLLYVVIFGVVAVCIVIIIIETSRQKKIQAEIEMEHTKEILSKPLDTFGSSEIDNLKDKYE